MSTPTLGAPYTMRIMVEVIENGSPRRIHVWRGPDGRDRVSFARDLAEPDVARIMALGLALGKAVDVPALFRGPTGKRRRFIDPAG